jgi:hypothetical protein
MKLGNTNISKAYLGITEIKKVILGTTEVWTSFVPFGEAAYTTPGTYSWTAPPGVTSVSALAVGGGGGGTFSSNGGRGGSGGGLGWRNNIPVVPGQSYTVIVGAGGNPGGNGGISEFINPSTVRGLAGLAGGTGTGLVAGGGFVGDGGGNGGNAGTSNTTTTGGGGGAGGYSGNGGNGGNGTGSSSTSAGQNGTGGGGGGGGGGGSADASGAGGGVGILGQGANGTGGPGSTANGRPGTGGSGGVNGSANPGSTSAPSTGGLYGGGGGGADGNNGENGPGGSGAVRIVWGTGVSYPTNAVQINANALITTQRLHSLNDGPETINGNLTINWTGNEGKTISSISLRVTGSGDSNSGDEQVTLTFNGTQIFSGLYGIQGATYVTVYEGNAPGTITTSTTSIPISLSTAEGVNSGYTAEGGAADAIFELTINLT